MDKLLIIGAGGQIGTVLTAELRKQYGNHNVVATDLRPLEDSGPTAILNATDRSALLNIVVKEKVTQIYHLAAILSAKGEANPIASWDINMTSLLNVLEVARDTNIRKLFFPSSIAVFGHEAKLTLTPQHEVLIPTTVYGISKAVGENWCNYYHHKFGMDIRSLRYPGIIGYQSLPGGGTTDYAVQIYHDALAEKLFECFLKANTRLPMMYMDDAIRATIELMEAPSAQIKVRTSYNIAAMSFSPEEIAAEIKQRIPEFKIKYKPDFRQQIAKSWPKSIDDKAARLDWKWQHRYDISTMTDTMLANLKK